MLDPLLADIAAKLRIRGDVTAERLGQGLSNQTWLLRGAEDAVVIRRWQSLEAARRLPPEFEISLWRAAASRNLAPEIRWADVAEGVVAAEFLGDARTWTDGDFADPDNWPRLSRLLSRLNELSHPLPRYSPLAAATAYTNLSGGEAMSRWERTRSEELLSLAVAHERDNAATVVCHNDLLPANVLELPGGGLRLIDFEYAGRGHPVVDWATIAVFGDIEVARRAEFLDVMSRDNVLRPNAFPDAIRLVQLLAYFWARMVLRSRPSDAQLTRLCNRMQAALE